jgi:hypothetical protein
MNRAMALLPYALAGGDLVLCEGAPRFAALLVDFRPHEAPPVEAERASALVWMVATFQQCLGVALGDPGSLHETVEEVL